MCCKSVKGKVCRGIAKEQGIIVSKRIEIAMPEYALRGTSLVSIRCNVSNGSSSL